MAMTPNLVLVSDRADDRTLVAAALRSAWVIAHAAGLGPACEALAHAPCDAVLGAVDAADGSIDALLASVAAQRPGTPVIVVADCMDAEAAVELLHAGASDVVLRENLPRRLPLALARACAVAAQRKPASPADELVRTARQLPSLTDNFT
ncbi:MAG TPA: hypothetical protein VMU42_19815, partial [Candidatus Sulfotelmatobacter sp.]|nr:hypothetical protein [Candidatus Sulfotelmatobacter sp.]